MYRNFFSLSDLPFSIAPDPKYLFMSDRHKEALSHLTYGLGDVGGFALLTGEVGTGKTTVSRCLMEQLPENTQAVFILNPMLSSQELLATICDKLEVNYQKEEISLKNLTDKISEKLLENHEGGINTLLIIDEAQHLQPEVLEQLRLLTNLETNTKKLLQIILIGQPELQQLLQRRDLRQLAQRITARYHLMPLTKSELSQYIEHRLTVADCVRKIFDKGALNKIYQLSQGVPRLINLLCHSALMLAYNQNDSVVNKKTVIAAAETVLGVTNLQHKQGGYQGPLMLLTGLSVVAFIALAASWWGQTYGTVNTTTASNIVSKDNDMSLVSDNEPEEQVIGLVAEEVRTEAPSEIAVQAAGPVIYVSSYQQATLSQGNDKVNYGLHTVRAGENLYNISVAYNTKISALRQWNNIHYDGSISVGDKLYVIAPKDFLNQAAGVSTVFNHTEVNVKQEDKMRAVSAEKNVPLNNSHQNKGYKIKNVEGVSNDLFARFQAAINDTEDESMITAQSAFRATTVDSMSASIKPVSQLSPSAQNSLPKMDFEQHIYASDGAGWVTVNGRDRYEGDYINAELRVDKILPQQVILSFKGEQFSMPALTNW